MYTINFREVPSPTFVKGMCKNNEKKLKYVYIRI